VKRSYGQYCGVAKALDVVGGRWTLLIIRDLFLGPRRFKDLLEGLPGIGTNLLTERLRQLENEGLIQRRTLPPPAGSTVYELTDSGRELESVLLGLARWGVQKLEDPSRQDVYRPRFALFAALLGDGQEALRGVHESYEFRIDDEIIHVRVEDGDVQVSDGPADAPDLVVTTDVRTFLEAGRDPAVREKALAEERLHIEGSPEALRHCRAVFEPAISATTAASPAA
jgi:DNA-binding HxlR family transcriptional regulator